MTTPEKTVTVPLEHAVTVALHYCRTVCDRRRPQTHDPACLWAVVSGLPVTTDAEKLAAVEHLCQLAEQAWAHNAIRPTSEQVIPPFDRLGVARLRAILVGELEGDLARPELRPGMKGPTHPVS